jgi:hypothetical protein
LEAFTLFLIAAVKEDDLVGSMMAQKSPDDDAHGSGQIPGAWFRAALAVIAILWPESIPQSKFLQHPAALSIALGSGFQLPRAFLARDMLALTKYGLLCARVIRGTRNGRHVYRGLAASLINAAARRENTALVNALCTIYKDDIFAGRILQRAPSSLAPAFRDARAPGETVPEC